MTMMTLRDRWTSCGDTSMCGVLRYRRDQYEVDDRNEQPVNLRLFL